MITQHKSRTQFYSKEAQTKFYNLRKAGIENILFNEQTNVKNDREWSEALQFKKLFSNQVLTNLPNKDFAGLLPHVEIVSLLPDEELSQPGDALPHIYFPENAVVSHLHVLADGNSTEIAMMGRESIVGLSELFSARPSPYWTQVTIAGNALRIKMEIVKKQLERGGALQKLLTNRLTTHLGQISQKVVCNIHHQAESRFCSWLLMIQDRIGASNLRLTQDQIARYLGVHRPSITHIAQSLREKAIINYVRSHIQILDRCRLEQIACECYQATKEPAVIEFAETIQ